MLLLHGHYKFFRRRVALRNAWCTVCKAPRLAVGFRSWVVLHLFWIPLLPVARVTDWACVGCGNNPKANLTARPGSYRWSLVVAGLLLVGGLAVLISTLVTGRDPLGQGKGGLSDGIVSAAALVMVGSVFGWQIRRQLRRTTELGVDDGKTPVSALSGDTCPLCSALTLTRDKPRCEACQVEIQTR